MTAQEQIQINALKMQCDEMARDIVEIKTHLDAVAHIQEELANITEAINSIPKVYVPRTWFSNVREVAKWVIATGIGIIGLLLVNRKK